MSFYRPSCLTLSSHLGQRRSTARATFAHQLRKEHFSGDSHLDAIPFNGYALEAIHQMLCRTRLGSAKAFLAAILGMSRSAI
jgi:hypothetical protein